MLPKNPVKRTFYRGITSFLAAISSVLISIYESTLRIEIEGEDNLRILNARGQNHIVAIWHTFVTAAVFTLHHRRFCIYSDHPRIESYEKSWTHFFREVGLKTLRALGFDVLDASLGKQSAGVLNFIKKIQAGTPAVVAPDGPHGPIYEAKPGVIYMAAKSGSAVVPIGASFSRRILGANWDDFSLPLPFSRVAFVIGAPIYPPESSDEAALAQGSKEVEHALDALCFRANEILFGKSPPSEAAVSAGPREK
jgi:lysophospholipid acyltransferase (LPLAT)-like uncharacterized protein